MFARKATRGNANPLASFDYFLAHLPAEVNHGSLLILAWLMAGTDHERGPRRCAAPRRGRGPPYRRRSPAATSLTTTATSLTTAGIAGGGFPRSQPATEDGVIGLTVKVWAIHLVTYGLLWASIPALSDLMDFNTPQFTGPAFIAEVGFNLVFVLAWRLGYYRYGGAW